MYDEADRGTLAVSSQLTIAAHDEKELARRRKALSAQLAIDAHRATPGLTGPVVGCGSCTPHGCPQLDWANRTAAELAASVPVR